VPDEVYRPGAPPAARPQGPASLGSAPRRLAAQGRVRARHLRRPAGHAFERLDAFIAEAEAAKPAAATRQHSGSVLERIFGDIPELVGGSADLTGSNNTYVKNTAMLDAPTTPAAT
jgi:transketolase